MRRVLAWALLFSLAVLAAIVGARHPLLLGDISSAQPPVLGRVPEFELVDSSSKRVRLSDFKGPWVADFVFTRCALQCPMLTERMKVLKARLKGVSFVSFSVDASDTPEVLARYARLHGADWLFLSGKGMRRLVRNGFKLPLAGGGGAKEPIVHSRHLVLVDGQGRIRGYFDSSDASAIRKLRRQARLLAGPS